MKIFNQFLNYIKNIFLLPINYYKYFLISSIKERIVLLFWPLSFIFIIYTVVSEDKIKIKDEFYFNGNLSDCVWEKKIYKMKILNENTLRLVNIDREYIDLKYKYDSENEVFEILGENNNYYFSKNCLNRIVGKWIWEDGKYGKGFYFKKIKGICFSHNH